MGVEQGFSDIGLA